MGTLDLFRVATVVASISLTSGCSTPGPPSTDLSEGNGGPTARIRIFWKNGAGVSIIPGASCISEGSNRQETSESWSETFASFIGTASDVSLGIPETERSRNRDGGLLATEYLKEYRVTARKPVIITAGAVTVQPSMTGRPGSGNSCEVRPFYFIPEPGADYEAYLTGTPSTGCQTTLRKISLNGNSVEIPKYLVFQCAQPDS